MATTKLNYSWFPGDSISSSRLNTISKTVDEIVETTNTLDVQVENNTKSISSMLTTNSASMAENVNFTDTEDAETKVTNLEKQTREIFDDSDFLIDDIPNTNYSEIPMLGGQPAILFGAGTPQESIVPTNWIQYDPVTDTGFNWIGQPTKANQRYINTNVTSGGCEYVAVEVSGTNRLKWVNK